MATVGPPVSAELAQAPTGVTVAPARSVAPAQAPTGVTVAPPSAVTVAPAKPARAVAPAQATTGVTVAPPPAVAVAPAQATTGVIVAPAKPARAVTAAPAQATTAAVTAAPAQATTAKPAKPVKPALVAEAAALVGLLGYDAAVMIGLLPELGRVATWDGTAQLTFAVLFVMVIGLLVPVAVMMVFGLRRIHQAAAVCAKASAILLTSLFVIAVTTRFGHWGSMAAVPTAVVVTGVMLGLWIRLAGEGEEEADGLKERRGPGLKGRRGARHRSGLVQ